MGLWPLRKVETVPDNELPHEDAVDTELLDSEPDEFSGSRSSLRYPFTPNYHLADSAVLDDPTTYALHDNDSGCGCTGK